MKRFFIPLIGIIVLISFIPELDARKITKPTQRAVYHNNRGIRYLSEGNLKLAEVEFKTAVELSHDYIEAYNNLGIVTKKTGDLRNSILYFEKAVELDKNYADAYSHLSMVYLDLGNLSKALSLGKIAVKKGATKPITHYNLALVYLAKTNATPEKNYDEEAEKQLKTATELNPNMFEAHLTLARLYKRQKRFELAAIRYRLAIENHPFDPKIWTELGQVFQAMGDPAKAENAFRKAIEITRGAAVASNPHTQLGLEMMQRQEYTKAIEELKKAIKIDPKSEVAHYQLGTAYLNLGDIQKSKGKKSSGYYKSAISPLKSALKLNPHMADASYNLGLAYYKLGNTTQAKKEWIHTLSINQNHARTLYNLGILSISLGEKTEAIDYLCRFTKSAGQGLAGEVQNAKNLIKTGGGRCRN